ncbi:MAG: oligopeptide transporter, OPT family, partial [Candidatus Kapaibacterium sp.]
MDNSSLDKSELPENAYRELNPGEDYMPVMPANKVFPEVTPWSVGMGLLMAVIFSAAAAFSGLKIGQVFEAAIPISIIAVGASTFFKVKNPLGQNVIIQSIGASSGVIVAGAIFTIPGLYILQYKYPEIQVSFFQIFFSSLLGGFLGILFLIPFRKYFVKDMHGKFPFPEATATTEILITGEKGGSQAGILISSGLIGGLFDFMFGSLKLWSEVITTKMIPIGAALAEKSKIILKLNVSALIFSFGYLVGLKFSTIIVVGSLLSWLVFIPLLNSIGGVIAGAEGVNFFAAMSPEDIFREYVRPIGIGAIAMAGIIGIIKSSGVIGTAFKLAVAGLMGKNLGGETEEIRTQKDIKMTFIIIFSVLTIIAVFIFLLTGVDISLTQAIIALATLVIISFLFTTVAANAIAIVGTNPVSGMTLMTLIISSIVLVQAGLQGPTGMVSALIIGGIVCTALSMAGGFITDLKVGYWLGSSPKKQESWKFLGTLVSAGTVGLVIYILSQAYGFVKSDQFPDPLVAPQANAMAAVIEPLMLPGAEIVWMLFVVGAIIALLVNWLGISPLAFALGMFIPLDLNTPLIVGGLISHYIGKRSK